MRPVVHEQVGDGEFFDGVLAIRWVGDHERAHRYSRTGCEAELKSLLPQFRRCIRLKVFNSIKANFKQYPPFVNNLSRLPILTNAANPAVYEDISPSCIRLMDRYSKPIRRTVNSMSTSVQNMRVDHRGAYILVAQKLLNCPDVGAIRQSELDRWRMAV